MSHREPWLVPCSDCPRDHAWCPTCHGQRTVAVILAAEHAALVAALWTLTRQLPIACVGHVLTLREWLLSPVATSKESP
jgi:hypothetical protein